VEVFLPPELASQTVFEGWETGSENRQTELMRQLYFKQLHTSQVDKKSDQALVSLILEHAKKVIAHPARPTQLKTESFLEKPDADLAIEETIEETPLVEGPEHLLVQYQLEKPFSCVVILDTSSSMSGDKHLLASIAVAVLVLEVASKDNALVVFSSEAKTIKRLGGIERPEDTLLRFLKHQPKGFTNISAGLQEGLNQLKSSMSRKRKVGLIATDGRSTEGGDPLKTASQFDFLVVLHLCGAGSDLEASQAIAQAGKGICLQVEKFEDLPQRLYEALRMLSRR